MVEEAGLETEGMAETTSQLQAKLKALTDGKVDIMVDADNFKNTTEILREMSAEWEHMTDVERAAALELLGGKRQANTLSAIISNFDIVEDAIEASANSEGSALEENAKVLDSIQGRINLFNNSVETMWNNLLDDEWIKLIVDGGTELVKLIDKFGSLKTILFGILTYYSVFKKDKLDFAELFGIQGGKEADYEWMLKKDKQLDFDIGDTSSNKYLDIFNNGVDSKQILQIDDLQLFGQELDKLNNMDNAGVLSYIQDLDKVGKTSSNTAQALAAYASTVTDGNYSMQDAIQYVNQHNEGIKASGTAAKAAAIGHSLLNAAISMGISILISWIVSAVTKAINANKELAESVEDVMSEYERATKSLKDHRDTLDDIEDDYVKLASGVDNLGRNISLSTDEYERYNEIVNKIAEMFPDMITGYTEEGNAIIGLKGNVEALEEAYKAEAKAARDALLTSANDTVKNFKNNTTKDDFWTAQNKFDELAFFEDLVSNGSSVVSDWFTKVGTMPVDNWLEGAGIDSTTWFSSPETVEKEIDSYFTSIKARYNQLKTEVASEATPIKTTVSAYLEEDLNYQQLSEEGKNIAQAIISGFDTEFYARDEFEDWSDITTWLDTNVIQNLQNTDNMAEFNAAFNLQTQFNDGSIPVDDYISKTKEFLELLEQLGFDEEIIKTVRGIFDIDDYETKINSAKELLDSEGDIQVGTLSKQDLDIIDKNKTDWKKEFGIDDDTLMSWEDLTNAIQKAKNSIWEASTAFDQLSEEIDSIQSAYDVLSDAVTQYNENGYLTLDNLQALLSLEPEYLALLQMENGQLSINQSALETMIQAKLAEAKATAVQSAITQLNALAAKTEADAINESTNAANNAVNNLGSYANSLSVVAQNAISAAGAVAAFNAAVEGAQANELVDQSEIDAILANMNNQINLVDSIGANLGSNFKGIVSPGKSSSSGSSSDDKDDAFQKAMDYWENRIAANQAKYKQIQNEIDLIEAQGGVAGKEYYEEQVELENERLKLLEAQKAEAQDFLGTFEEGSDEWFKYKPAYKGNL